MKLRKIVVISIFIGNASGKVLIDEGGDDVDISEEFACLAPADVPGPDCPPV